jgi:hypothetical protein
MAMVRYTLIVSLALIILRGTAGTVSALSGEDLTRLQAAGVGPLVIEALIREKSVETGALTVADLVRLRTAGIANDTLEAVIARGSFLRDRKPVIYGTDVRPVRLASVTDLVALKDAGLDEKTLRALIRCGADGAGEAERARALAWLEKMGLRLDTRAPE